MGRQLVIHVNQQTIQRNRKTGSSDPPLIVRDYQGSKPADTITIKDKQGNVVAEILHRPHDPLSCGARVWIACNSDVVDLELN